MTDKSALDRVREQISDGFLRSVSQMMADTEMFTTMVAAARGSK